MPTGTDTVHNISAAEERQRQNEAFLNAVKNCDDETFSKIISILAEAKLLHE